MFCFIRFVSELWLLILHLIGTIGLFFLLFSPKNIGRCTCWAKAGLTDVKDDYAGPSAAYKRDQRLASLTAIIAVPIMLAAGASCVSLFSALTGQSLNDQEYLLTAKAAASDYAVDISKLLWDIFETNTLTDEDKELLYGLIQTQIELDQVIIDYDMTGLDDYQELHAGLQSLCRDDIEALRRIMDTIDDGFAPSKEMLRNYIGLRGENYLWVVEKIASELIRLDIEMMFDLW